MALEFKFDSLRVDLDNDAGSVVAYYSDFAADLPDRGETVDVSAYLPGTWYCDTVNAAPNAPCPHATIGIRRAGRVWTWTGLTPIQRYGDYDLTPAAQANGTDGYAAGYQNWFTNWDSAFDWGPADAEADLGALSTWEVEFVAATDYADTWRRKKNGTWAAITPPVAGAGIYYCRAIRSEPETYATRAGGSATVYRHFAVFWLAPVVDSVRMTWNKTAW